MAGGPKEFLDATRPRIGPVGWFAITAFAVLALFGFVLTRVVGSQFREHAIGSATEFTRGISGALVVATIGADSLDDGLESGTIARLDTVFAAGMSSGRVVRVKLWMPTGVVAYSDDHALIGRKFPVTSDVSEALAGGVHSGVANGKDGDPEHVDDRELGDVLEVYVPLMRDRAEHPIGVTETYLSYAPVQQEIASEQQRITVAIAAGMTLLFLVLLPIVARVSRRLRLQVQDNRRLALHDPLTGLPNRLLFAERAQSQLCGRRSGEQGALMILDLDGFKDVNDTLGHVAGDALLVEVASRLSGWLPPGCTLARLGGDEFGVVMPGWSDRDRVTAAASELGNSMREPFVVAGISIGVEVSVGIVLSHASQDDLGGLMRRADIAMYAAKRSRQGFMLYQPDLELEEPEFFTLVSDLRRAIPAGELCLHYQPKAQMGSRDVRSVEALVRWQHPQRGLLPPAEFIRFAEHSNLIGQLTAWVINEALRQCREWADAGRRLSVAVNLSQASLSDPAITTIIADALTLHDVPPHALEIEVTESALAGDLQVAAAMLRELDELGVKISIDDYGTGFSSIAHLRELPVTCIKIDRSYVSGMLDDPKNATIVNSTIKLARDLGLNVVAEGVESHDEWQELERIGCDVAQGYFISRPMAPDDLMRWLGEPCSLQPDALQPKTRDGHVGAEAVMEAAREFAVNR